MAFMHHKVNIYSRHSTQQSLQTSNLFFTVEHAATLVRYRFRTELNNFRLYTRRVGWCFVIFPLSPQIFKYLHSQSRAALIIYTQRETTTMAFQFNRFCLVGKINNSIQLFCFHTGWPCLFFSWNIVTLHNKDITKYNIKTSAMLFLFQGLEANLHIFHFFIHTSFLSYWALNFLGKAIKCRL